MDTSGTSFFLPSAATSDHNTSGDSISHLDPSVTVSITAPLTHQHHPYWYQTHHISPQKMEGVPQVRDVLAFDQSLQNIEPQEVDIAETARVAEQPTQLSKTEKPTPHPTDAPGKPSMSQDEEQKRLHAAVSQS